MPLIDVVDDTFVAAAPARLAPLVHDPVSWRRWWPTLRLVSTRDRGHKGHQWVATGSARAGLLAPQRVGLVGTAEIWLEPWGDGVVVHHYLRLDPAGDDGAWSWADPSGARWADRQRAAFATGWKRQVHEVKDAVEAGRLPGTPAARAGRQGLLADGR